MKQFNTLRFLAAVMLVLVSHLSQAQQTVQVLNDNTLNLSSWGSAYSYNLWSSSYIGFNLKSTGPWGSPWSTSTDGGNNGASAIIGGIGGTLQFLTTPTLNASAGGQTFQDRDMPSKVRMVLNEKGQLRVGEKSSIGTHVDYKLSVYGKLTATSIYVLADNSTNWADYVFAKNYRLAPLSEVEAYISTYGHLPEMPTTSEVATNGINVAQMNTLLLKKVEELTLHLISLQKKVQNLEAKKVAIDK